MRVYLAGPFGTPKSCLRKNALQIKKILETKGFEVYAPWKCKIPHAWDYTNSEWGAMVFSVDMYEINNSDFIVMIDYGRVATTAGTNWEVGYAYGIGKRVLAIEMTDAVISLMVANGSYSRVKGIDGLKNYDFSTMPVLRTETEQK